ncbi:MAG: hypothetical protein SFX72_06890 [Isosphaeraceae bacterium]|nr:hypothetical protein [Isosphaeraceae bacterium]
MFFSVTPLHPLGDTARRRSHHLHTVPKEGNCMVPTNLRLDAILEFVVILFQVFGVAALCLNRLVPQTRWADRGRIGFVIAMVGLGVAGALCGRHDSEFALFAGGTMTILLIGMTIGGAAAPSTASNSTVAHAEA